MAPVNSGLSGLYLVVLWTALLRSGLGMGLSGVRLWFWSGHTPTFKVDKQPMLVVK